MRIAIIPARGGSKRIPGKNIRDFLGKPMLHWAIEAARNSDLFEHIVVSTDSTEIAEEAVKAGADVPFMRPAALADDHAVTRDVINHAIHECTQIYGSFDHCCCIYGTSPFLSAEDLSSAWHILQTQEVPLYFQQPLILILYKELFILPKTAVHTCFNLSMPKPDRRM